MLSPRRRVPRHLLSARHWPSWCAVWVIWLLARLPYPLLILLGRGIGQLAPWAMPARRRIAATNLRLCFPEMGADERARLLRTNMVNLGIMLVEFALGWMGSRRSLERVPVDIQGLGYLEDARRRGVGVLLVGAHFTHLELCGRLLSMCVPLAGMYRAMDNEVLEFVILRARLRYAAAMFTKDDLLGTVRYLRRGGILWYAPDQDMRGKEAVFAPFFGVQAATITATHHLARLSGAVVLPFAHRRLAHGGYEIRILPPLDDFPSSDVGADTQRVNGAIETMVASAPEQYLWIHKRFKTRPPGEGEVYGGSESRRPIR